jgi:hypothetical protein
LLETHPHLFSAAPVFVGGGHMRQVEKIIQAIGVVVGNPGYRQGALARAPAIARAPQAARGVFFGYDFHITPAGPKLIEINTNAGGALLNIELLRAQQACCPPVADYLRAAQAPERAEAAILDMFADEWRLARGAQPLKTAGVSTSSTTARPTSTLPAIPTTRCARPTRRMPRSSPRIPMRTRSIRTRRT